MHRAEQVLQAAAGLIEAESDLAAAVFQNRSLSLSADDQELPAVNVAGGSDEPVTDWDILNPTTIHSQIEVRVAAYAQGSTERDVVLELTRLRSVVHRALFADRTLGLPFAIDTKYGGAEAPLIDPASSPMGGSQVFVYQVHYEMGLEDPE